ncbi:MAG: VWA-like domain-containing protein [Nitrososphaerales archaeon]
MSSRVRSSISKDLMEKEYVSPEEKAQALATAIYETSKTHPFMGSVLQCLSITYSHQISTASIMFEVDAKRWDMLINPFFFCKKLSPAQRKAVMLHELSHITHRHPLRVPFLKISARKRMLMNIAADMAINQFIKDLPSGCPDCPPIEAAQPCPNEMCPGRCIDVKDYYDVDPVTKKKIPWPLNQTMETYYEKLIRRFDDPDNEKDNDGNAGGGANTNDLPQTIDEHLWDSAVEEKDMLDATEELVKRAMIKAKLSHDDLPGHVRDLLEDIKTRRAELNYRALIMSAMKKHASGHDRKHTWLRKSKRFGFKAPGTKVGDLPRLELYIDTSGSISIEELNEFLDIVDNFLKVGSRKCNISFFHTELYGRQQYKIGSKINRSQIQIGGTSLKEVLSDIWARRGDLNIIVTDGCYDDVPFESWMKPGQTFPQVLWIISKQGKEDHPLKRLGDTVKVPN